MKLCCGIDLHSNNSVIASSTEQGETVFQKRAPNSLKVIVSLLPELRLLKSVSGIGDIPSLTIMLETGDIKRFEGVGNYTSYCRCVDSRRMSNGKKNEPIQLHTTSHFRTHPPATCKT